MLAYARVNGEVNQRTLERRERSSNVHRFLTAVTARGSAPPYTKAFRPEPSTNNGERSELLKGAPHPRHQRFDLRH